MPKNKSKTFKIIEEYIRKNADLVNFASKYKWGDTFKYKGKKYSNSDLYTKNGFEIIIPHEII